MNIIQIADQGAFSPFPVSLFLLDQIEDGVRLEDWVRQHHNDWVSGSIFVIDAQFSFFGRENEQFGGIKLLKILRLLGYRQHCVVYSFMPLPQILAKSKNNMILLSTGTSFVQLPEPINEDFCEKRLGFLSEEDPISFLNAEALEWLGTKRHSLANWWGVLRVYDVLHACGLIEDDVDVPKEIQAVLGRDSSYQGLLMNYVRFQGPRPSFSVSNSDLRSPLKSFKNAAMSLWAKNLKVVYVDDQAKDGWSYLLQVLLYGRERPDLFYTPSLPHEGIEIDNLARCVCENNADLIILDIRLEPKDDSALPEELSGIKLIKQLVDELSVSCPILVFTASDKRKVSEKALEYGADAVWTKEGIDESANVPKQHYSQFSFDRVLGLVSQIQRLTGFEYKVLYDCLRETKRIESSLKSFWWQETKWYPGDKEDRTPVNKSTIVNELGQLFRSHKQFLLATQPAIKDLSYDMLTVKLCRMMELIHPSSIDEDGKFVSLGKAADTWPKNTIAATYAQFLVTERNKIVHVDPFFGFLGADVYRYKKTLDVFFTYLTLSDPSAYLGKLSGTLSKSINKEGKTAYILTSGFNTGYFKAADSRYCEAVLNGQDSQEGVEAVIRAPRLQYNLVFINFEKYPGEGVSKYWTADAGIINSGQWGVNLSLFNILPRDGVQFRIQGNLDSVEVGSLLYYYINWHDDKDDTKKCYYFIFNVTTNPPEATKHTFWTGRVAHVTSSKNGSTVRLEDINPPYNAFFKLGEKAISYLQKNRKKNVRVVFSPRWHQGWEVTNVSLKKKPLVYINLDALMSDEYSGALDTAHKLAAKCDIHIIATTLATDPSIWAEKMSMASAFLDKDLFDRLMFCNQPGLLKGDYIIDIKGSTSAAAFEGKWISLGGETYPTWESILCYFLKEP